MKAYRIVGTTFKEYCSRTLRTRNNNPLKNGYANSKLCILSSSRNSNNHDKRTNEIKHVVKVLSNFLTEIVSRLVITVILAHVLSFLKLQQK